MLSGLLHSVSGLLAILNEQRQILALNDNFLRILGIDDPKAALGLRHGEAFHCIHADEGPAGCGTTKYCSTCGAAVAIVTSMQDNAETERLCALTARRDGKLVDIALLVRAQPITIQSKRLLLLLVQDVTEEQNRAALERTFFHDINNLLTGLLPVCEMQARKNPNELTESILDTARRLCGEVDIQRHFSSSKSGHYRGTRRACRVEGIVAELQRFFSEHPTAKGKRIEYETVAENLTLTTDTSALSRVLSNMLLNALEATRVGGVVRLWVESSNDEVSFSVWNRSAIPHEVQPRLFQRNFSTKSEAGRGIGTFSMKFLGEEVLGGNVRFTSSQEEGTVFRFTHPISE